MSDLNQADSKRRATVSNIRPRYLLTVLRVVVAGIEKALGGGK